MGILPPVVSPLLGQELCWDEVERGHRHLHDVDEEHLCQEAGPNPGGEVEPGAGQLVGPGGQEAGGGLAWMISRLFLKDLLILLIR